MELLIDRLLGVGQTRHCLNDGARTLSKLYVRLQYAGKQNGGNSQ
jgi:hypothetical protein